ncbi:LOW QUALITY PROTEIN: hypothetical protein HID58_065465 [Brassica napus]|uniref:Uncharacterized protein n=1 Tax=Brassica napus TaxID=3708 RepID=A0ABQ7ZCV7_BRANA|nr:LOW QUALITY PROTEIN: hypothetical protein HID58_065422 [Brassica napus]KAH0878071.1 LOW QUALITY PROTEIN: hypothetical protein HID58_065465 [Brassica napus]
MPPQGKNLLLRSSNSFLALWQIKRQLPPPKFILHFSSVSSGAGDSQLLFKLIYFWKARNNSKGGILLGLEMLMMDEEVSSRPGDSQLLFKLIYFWKARNNSKGGILLGLEMLMIDEEVHVHISILCFRFHTRL